MPIPYLPWLAIPLLTVPLSVIPYVPAWVFMWLMVGALFFTAKVTVLARMDGTLEPRQLLSFLFLSHGLDPKAFFERRVVAITHSPQPAANSSHITLCVLWLGFGLTLMYGLAHRMPNDYAAAWIFMLSVVLVLHRGLCGLSTALWLREGVRMRPIMRAPLLATSLSRLWNTHWNTAFSDWARLAVFQPVAARFGPRIAFWSVFLISGLAHELVIALPAGGGYGLSTAYFLLQGAGILFEKSQAGRALGLGRGLRGWFFTLTIAGAPIVLLFSPTFVANVALPMARAIGAL